MQIKANKENKMPGSIAEEMHRRCGRRSAKAWQNKIFKVYLYTALLFVEQSLTLM